MTKNTVQVVVTVLRRTDGGFHISSRGHTIPIACAAISTLMASLYSFLKEKLGEDAQITWNGPKSGVFDLYCPVEYAREAKFTLFSLKTFAKQYPQYLLIEELTMTTPEMPKGVKEALTLKKFHGPTTALRDLLLDFVELYNVAEQTRKPIKLYSYQRKFMSAIIMNLMEHAGRTITGLWSRQSGKSESLGSLLGALCVLLPVLAQAYPDDKRVARFIGGLHVGVYAPKEEQSKFIYDKIRARAESPHGKEVMSDPEIDTHIVKSRGDTIAWSNGSFVKAETASPTSKVEGGTFHILIMDEAQDITEYKMTKELRPMLTATRGSVVMIGTVSALKGGFYKAIKHNVALQEQDPAVRLHYEYPYDKVIDEKRKIYEETGDEFHLNYELAVNDELARMGGNLEAEEFKMNYRLMWQDMVSSAIDAIAFIACADKDLEMNIPRKIGLMVAGLDLGKSLDKTVLTVGSIDDEIMDSATMLRAGEEPPSYFNKTILGWWESQSTWREQYIEVVSFLRDYAVKYLLVDATGKGDVICERFQDLLPGIEVVPFVFGSKSKNDLYRYYIQEIVAHRLRYPAGRITKESHIYKAFEQEHFNLERTYNGIYLQCQAPEGEKDDYADSGALFCYAAKLAKPKLRAVELVQDTVISSRLGRAHAINTRADRYRSGRRWLTAKETVKMSHLTSSDIQPLASRALTKLQGMGQSFDHGQATAADAVASVLGTVKKPGIISEFAIALAALPANGESMSYSLLVNAVEVALFVATPTNVQAGVHYPLGTGVFTGSRAVNVGDILTVTRDYTAGGGPTPIGFNNVHVEIADADFVGTL